MFESQNGRGKELEAYNLLKAFHIRAMSGSTQAEKIECDKQWEDAALFVKENGVQLDLLRQLFNEQLYRPRVWARGDDAYMFSKKKVDEFKGVTIDNDSSIDYPYQNILVQQSFANHLMRMMNMGLFKIKSRFVHGDSEKMNPFVSMHQQILNGKAFFDYAETYVEIYKRLFIDLESSQLQQFKEFYKKYCHYEKYNWRKGDGYIREVYKSAVMAVFDKFGENGLNDLYEALFVCLYRFRLSLKQVRYNTMAKADNSGWIFQTLHNAKTMVDLQIIKQKALQFKESIDIHYNLEAIKPIFQK